jgi:hypothetical protein
MVSTSAVPKTAMSVEERRLRSRIAKLVSSQPILHGTILERKRKCCRPTCRCATDPDKRHPAMYVFVGGKKKMRQLYVRREWQEQVRQWVANDHELRRLTRELSDLYWEKARQPQS